jgi:hypothetical protein
MVKQIFVICSAIVTSLEALSWEYVIMSLIRLVLRVT